MADEPKIEEPEAIPEAQDSGIQEAKGDEALNQLVNDMPKPVPDAIEAAQVKQAGVEEIQKKATDGKGRAFDPNIHAADAQGNPILTGTGRFKKKFRVPGTDQPKAAGLNMPEDVDPRLNQIKAEATKWADTFIMAGMGIVGDEWKPEDGERESLIFANEQVFLKYGVVQVHPLANMGLIYGLYITKRVLTKPKTKSVFIKFWDSSKMFCTNLWLKLTGKKIKVSSTENEKG